IYTVGKGSHRSPRLVHFNWGDTAHPTVSIVGTGVAFDTGGLDVKPSSAMQLRDKERGGRANAIGLASMIMTHRLALRV
ncbi:leucyl aminopeptidase family protein, partial [Francisella tularensis subsp. holarctica]|nr:leucyl aminopeptidase family protein [Francisella tularensis subsp. holarctica]